MVEVINITIDDLNHSLQSCEATVKDWVNWCNGQVANDVYSSVRVIGLSVLMLIMFQLFLRYDEEGEYLNYSKWLFIGSIAVQIIYMILVSYSILY